VASVILVALAFYYRMPATWNLLMLPVLVLITVLLTLGVVLWLSALTVKYRDVRHVIPFALQIGFFCTPIMYPASLIVEEWRWLIFFNPMTGIVEGIRSALTGRPFDWASIAFSSGVTLVVLVLSVAAFHRTEKSFADLI
jgi:lipopolysaccharide transport system permease protein